MGDEDKPSVSVAANDAATIAAMRADRGLRERIGALYRDLARYRYSYNFTWMGRPIIQLPDDVLAIQELVWRVQPARIVETGVAHGGSLVFHASLLRLLGGDRRVIGVDIDIRAPNRAALEAHAMSKAIDLIEGSSVDPAVVARVSDLVGEHSPVLVILDSNHTHEHVLAELRAYAPLVNRGSYLIVLDTIIADLPDETFPGRPWSPTDNPKTAVHAFLTETDRFEVDASIHEKLLFTSAPEGYLRCVKGG